MKYLSPDEAKYILPQGINRTDTESRAERAAVDINAYRSNLAWINRERERLDRLAREVMEKLLEARQDLTAVEKGNAR